MDETLRIEIFPADLDRCVAFYRAVGFEVRRRDAGPPPYAFLGLGTVRLGACEAQPVQPSQRAWPACTEHVVEVDDVRAWRDRVVAAGVTLDEDLRERPWGMTDFRFSDPDGYYWRFTDRGQ